MRTDKYNVSEARRRELFDQRPGEDVHQMIARQVDMASPFEAAWLYVLRQQESQRGALMMVQAAKAAQWGRRAVYAVLASIPINAAVTLLVNWLS